MKFTSIAIAALLGAGLSSSMGARAEDGLKPGLWEMQIREQKVDGHDHAADMSAQMAKMKEMMASMPPERRAQMEAMMRQHGAPQVADNGALRVCMTPEMAKRGAVPVDRSGHCQSTSSTRSGDHLTFEFSCLDHGTKTSGRGQGVVSANVVDVTVDAVIESPKAAPSHVHTETRMTYVGADCGDVKPAAARP